MRGGRIPPQPAEKCPSRRPARSTPRLDPQVEVSKVPPEDPKRDFVPATESAGKGRSLRSPATRTGRAETRQRRAVDDGTVTGHVRVDLRIPLVGSDEKRRGEGGVSPESEALGSTLGNRATGVEA